MENEATFIQRSQKGDLDAFNQLVLHYQGQVYNLALRMLGNQASAADAAQEAFISAYQAIASFHGGNFRSWLLRITANACKDMMRSARARPSLSLESLVEPNPGNIPQSSAESPEDFALRSELGAEIQRGLDSLPAEQRLAVVLIDVQGYSYEEAAQVMGASLGTVKSRLSRARERLRDYLRQHGELLPAQFRLEG
ncbi:MAG: sigma-70 family RNA polymerase sigma factor [Chloroflexi bacterium]|nr:sigma-70 family RNA polymerase sigma factor [Chloroflexota bacterium]